VDKGLSDKLDFLADTLDKMSDELREQSQILKRLLLLYESSSDAHSKMIFDLEEISSKLKPKTQKKNEGIGMKDQKLLAFISQRARENKYDPNTDPVLADFRKKWGYRFSKYR